MSHRAAKKIRQFLRRNGIGVQGAAYTARPMNQRLIPRDGLDKEGKPMYRTFEYTGTVSLADNCARAMYKDTKRHGQVPA